MCPMNLAAPLVLLAIMVYFAIVMKNSRPITFLFTSVVVAAAIAFVYFIAGHGKRDSLDFETIVVTGGFIWFVVASSKVYAFCRLSDWARENGVTLLSWRSAWFFEGPNPIARSKYQRVYRIKYRDTQGNVHEGWITFGTYWGLEPEKVSMVEDSASPR